MTYYLDGKYVGKFIGEFKNGKSYDGVIILPNGKEVIVDLGEFDNLKEEMKKINGVKMNIKIRPLTFLACICSVL